MPFMCLYNLCFLKGALKGHVIEKSTVNSLVECGLKCASLLPDCKSLNYITKHPGQSAICEINNSSKSHAHKDDFVRQPNSEYFETIANENQQDNHGLKQVYVYVACACFFAIFLLFCEEHINCRSVSQNFMVHNANNKYISFFI